MSSLNAKALMMKLTVDDTVSNAYISEKAMTTLPAISRPEGTCAASVAFSDTGAIKSREHHGKEKFTNFVR
jgi:hypothetical protein